MPNSGFSIPVPETEFPVIGLPALGGIDEQRATMSILLQQHGWPEPSKEDTGRPRLGTEYCSLSHGGGWVAAARSPTPIGIDLEEASSRLEKVRRRYVGPHDQPVLDQFGDSLTTLCKIWTAKEAAFKVFGTGVDFLNGLTWTSVHPHSAQLTAVSQNQPLILRWHNLGRAASPPSSPSLSPPSEPNSAKQPDTWLAACTFAR
ncbi:4'-phosphopantetheinyl transferase superfamily protein [Flavobacteriales bacterium]|nr:4'-phosphopantetheinyl transferase superfamily protein [Flavobacteriales bacterium]